VLTYGVHEFEEYYALPGNGALAFNVSQAIPEDSWYGSLLQGTIGFRPEMSWLQVIVWVLYVGITLTLFIRQARRKTPRVVTSPIDVVATAG
jgi:high-affinity iron transporter